MRRLAAVLLVFTLVLPSTMFAADDTPLSGYSTRSSQTEREWETKFRAIPEPSNLREYMKHLSARPHHVGSPYDKENAEWILARFKEWGLDAHIETFDVLFPTPKVRVLEMTEPTKFTAKLEEPALAVDPTSNQKSEQLPTYNAYSIDGDVTAPLVFVNYGLPEDYEKLDRLGISVKGKIVIAKYLHSWRGVKPKVAAEHGAVGCIIYSEPQDDGYTRDNVFPQGPMRNPDGVQRGSVMDFASSNPGDPLTPGYVASPEHPRLSRSEAKSITKIPVLPISYGDAQPLLAALKGPMAPDEWRGSLPIPYHVGPGPATVHLKLEFNWDLKPVNDVIAKIPGSVAPDEWIVRGNHHDAWVNGAEDPLSGTSPLLEEARAFGLLLKQGWKPRRTIIYAAWDGEEPMLLGSTEWAEAHADELRQHAAVYINSDGNDRGLLSMGGSHSAGTFHQRSRARYRRSRDEDVSLAAAAVGRHRTGQVCRRAQGVSRARRPAHQRARLGNRLHRVPRSSRYRYARSWVMGARTSKESTTPSTTTFTGTPISLTTISFTDVPWRRPQALR